MENTLKPNVTPVAHESDLLTPSATRFLALARELAKLKKAVGHCGVGIL